MKKGPRFPRNTKEKKKSTLSGQDQEPTTDEAVGLKTWLKLLKEIVTGGGGTYWGEGELSPPARTFAREDRLQKLWEDS